MKNYKINRTALLFSTLLLTAFLAACGVKQPSQQDTASDQTNKGGEQGQNTQKPIEAKYDVTVAENATLGKIFTDGKGMTLYIYTKDAKDSSVCYGGCAVNWPPLLVKDSAKVDPKLILGKFGTITRTDGTKQVTYEGAPLYYWINDKNAGDTSGQGVGGVWYVYKVADDDLAPAGATSTQK